MAANPAVDRGAFWDDGKLLSNVTEPEANTRAERVRSRLEGSTNAGTTWVPVKVGADGTVATSGGGGPVTIADGADVAQGTTTDVSGTNTVIGKLKAIATSLAGTLTADVSDRAARLLGHVTVDNVSLAVSGPLTDTQLRASAPTVAGGANVFHVDDNAASLTVDAPVGTPVWVRLSDGAAAFVGQKTMASSVPVVVASDQSAIPVSGPLTDAQLRASAPTVAGGANVFHVDDNASSLTVDAPVGTPAFARLSDGAAALIGQKVMTTSLPVVVASDQSTLPAGGNIAHDGVDSGNPLKIGGKVIAAAGTPSFVSAVADRADGAFDAAGRLMIMEPPCWTLTHVPAANTVATATKAASAGVKHVLTTLNACVHNSGAATAIVLTVVIRDGATGVGTILWTVKLAVAATTLTLTQIFLNDLHIVGTAGNAMCVEFTAAGGANTNEIVNATGYDTV